MVGTLKAKMITKNVDNKDSVQQVSDGNEDFFDGGREGGLDYKPFMLQSC